MLIVLHVALPVLFMFILAFITHNSSDELFTKSLLVSALVLYYPMLFLLQGSAASLLQTNIFLSLGISIVAFIIIIVIWMNSSAMIYSILYLVVGVIGYGVTWLIQKAVESRKHK